MTPPYALDLPISLNDLQLHAWHILRALSNTRRTSLFPVSPRPACLCSSPVILWCRLLPTTAPFPWADEAGEFTEDNAEAGKAYEVEYYSGKSAEESSSAADGVVDG